MEEFTIIGLKELRENMEVYITKVHQGGSFVVVRKSKVVFRIAPPEEKKIDMPEEKKLSTGERPQDVWEEVVDFTKIKRGGVSIPDILTRL